MRERGERGERERERERERKKTFKFVENCKPRDTSSMNSKWRRN
jgi:hypothetical protein